MALPCPEVLEMEVKTYFFPFDLIYLKSFALKVILD